MAEGAWLPNLAVSACYLESHRLERNTGDRRVHGQRERRGNERERTRRRRREKREERRTFPPTGGSNSNGRPCAYIYMSDLIACRNDINHSRLTYPRPFASRYLPPFSPLPTPPGPSRERERERDSYLSSNPRQPSPSKGPSFPRNVYARTCVSSCIILVTAYISTYEFFYLTPLYG